MDVATERAPVTEDLTFARDIAPLVHRRCSSCHHTGGSGPFPLVTYRDVQRRLRQIQIGATRRRRSAPEAVLDDDERAYVEDVLRFWNGDPVE